MHLDGDSRTLSRFWQPIPIYSRDLASIGSITMLHVLLIYEAALLHVE